MEQTSDKDVIEKEVETVDQISQETHTQTESESDKPIVDLIVNGASNLKTLIYIWKSLSSTFVLNFTKEMIYSNTRNRTNTITINLEIHEKNILKYDFDARRLIGEDSSTEDLNEVCMIGAVQTNDLEDKLKLCGKGVNFAMSIWPDDSNLYFRQVGSDKGVLVIPLNPCSVQQYIPPPMPENTIVRILTSDFVSSIKSAIPNGVEKINFIPFADGLHMTTLGSVGQIVGHTAFGNCTTKYGENKSNKSDEVVRNLIRDRFVKEKRDSDKAKILIKRSTTPHMVTVEVSEIKSFSRLSSVSPESSMIRVFYNAEKRVLMLEGPVGTYGTYRVYLQNKKVGAK